MKLGVVGLPNVGKSTLFNAITGAGAQAANYPFCTIEPNTGLVPVPDERLDKLSQMYQPKKTTPAVVEFVDIAGLVKGASRGEGLGNRFLSHIREVDALVQVVRCFEDDNIVHVEGSVDPIRDMETINTELALADIETVEKRLDKARKLFKTGDKKYQAEAALAEKLLQHLSDGQPARSFQASEDDKALIASYWLLTDKPTLYAANIAEDALSKPEGAQLKALREAAAKQGAGLIVVSAQIEQELSGLDPEDKMAFLQELGLSESGLDRLARESYRLLDLISFLTVGEDECRAWTIKRGTRAPQAAGKIHTDFERGFIRAEIVPYPTLISLGSMAACREKGLIQSCGKDYVMQDGDVTLFRFNV